MGDKFQASQSRNGLFPSDIRVSSYIHITEFLISLGHYSQQGASPWYAPLKH
jgi:hypothetical protein